MRSLVRLSIGNPVGANLLFAAMILVGIWLGRELPREVFPEFSREGIEVQVLYPDASPEEVERLVSIPIEEACDAIEGTDEILSFSQYGFSRILVRLRTGTSVQTYLDDLRMEIDQIQDFPEDAKEPRIFEQKVTFPVVSVNLFGTVEEARARQVAERIRDSLKRIPSVSAVSVFGFREPELWVEIEPEVLERYGMTLAEVRLALSGQVRNFPGGTLDTEAGAVILRVLGDETDPEALSRLPVRALSDGTLLRIGDIGRVSRDFERSMTLGRYNGHESISLSVNKDREGDVIDIVEECERIVEAERDRLPPGLELGLSSDFSIYVKNRLRTLLQSGIFGLVLVLLILWIFLDAKVALMTALGIPVAVMGGMIAMTMLGITMNMLSMFAFILVLGLVVDDAIVVVENCYRYIEKGMKPRDAALYGAAEVAWPVLTTVATTIAAFGAMLMIEGELGQWMEPVPWVAGLTLLASLLEALIVLPSHFSEWISPADAAARAAEAQEAEGGSGPQRRRWYSGLQRVYDGLLSRSLRHRYPLILGAVMLMAIAGSLFDSGHLKFVLMPKFEAKLFMVNIETPTNYSLEQTHTIMKGVEKSVETLPRYELESYATLSGATYRDQSAYKTGAYLGQIFVELAEGGERTRTTDAIKDQIRESIGNPQGVTRIDFAEPQAGPGGADIELTLEGESMEQLKAAASAIEEYLAGFPAIEDLRDDLLPGTREIRLRLTDEGRMLGFNEALLAQQVLGAFAGDRATILRLERDPADLLVRHPERSRYDFRLLREMRVRAPSGASMPLRRVAELEEGRGLAQVVRENRKRAVTITAMVNDSGNTFDITNSVIDEFVDMDQRFPGVKMNFGGDQQQTIESMQSLIRALGVSFTLIYLLLALLFRSYLQPLVVLFSVPFAFLGVMYGMAIIGEPMSFMTMMGAMALSGVAVNDALVLVDFINKHREAGHGLMESVLRAGHVRMRPVLITSLTTIGGLIPLGFFASGQALFLAPMAKALIFGMITATGMTLLLVPAGYLVLHDAYRIGRRLFRRSAPDATA